ncbi:hypothetical protein AB0E04_40900 [Streptomyces sp. NPDC048251]|uniref:hypothetical protein n=1 Tax=Streptomyces sp. NPDC048251 TaxID=3154501 RepID=UPI003432561C
MISTKVVEPVENYRQTALPAPGTTVRIALGDHQTRMVQAMKQEASASTWSESSSRHSRRSTACGVCDYRL